MVKYFVLPENQTGVLRLGFVYSTPRPERYLVTTSFLTYFAHQDPKWTSYANRDLIIYVF